MPGSLQPPGPARTTDSTEAMDIVMAATAACEGPAADVRCAIPGTRGGTPHGGSSSCSCCCVRAAAVAASPLTLRALPANGLPAAAPHGKSTALPGWRTGWSAAAKGRPGTGAELEPPSGAGPAPPPLSRHAVRLPSLRQVGGLTAGALPQPPPPLLPLPGPRNRTCGPPPPPPPSESRSAPPPPDRADRLLGAGDPALPEPPLLPSAARRSVAGSGGGVDSPRGGARAGWK
jgi:hypothetical protein